MLASVDLQGALVQGLLTALVLCSIKKTRLRRVSGSRHRKQSSREILWYSGLRAGISQDIVQCSSQDKLFAHLERSNQSCK